MDKKLVGLMPVRNEDWILGLTARAALWWVDELIILDHASDDRSVEIEVAVAGEHPGRVQLLREDDPKWDEMTHRQFMLDHARRRGATHIAIIDADELVTANIAKAMRQIVQDSLSPDTIIQLPLYNLRGNTRQYHSNGTWGNRVVSVGFKDSLDARWGGDLFHRREPLAHYRTFNPIPQGTGGVMHFWGASERRLRAKHALYKLTERLRWPSKPVAEIEALYNLAVSGSPNEDITRWAYKPVPKTWVQPYYHLASNLRLDDVPWQEAEVRNILAARPELAEGLNLFGVPALAAVR